MSIDIPTNGKRLRSRLRSGEEGQAVLEFAMCLPPLLLIVTGIFTFGIALNNYLMLTNATSVGARQLSIARGQTLDPCALTAAAVYASAPTMSRAMFTLSLSLNGTTYNGTTCTSANLTTGASGMMAQGTPAQVTVSYPCRLTVFGMNIAPSCVLMARTTEAME